MSERAFLDGLPPCCLKNNVFFFNCWKQASCLILLQCDKGAGLDNSFRCLGSDILCLAKNSVKVAKIA